MVCERYKREGKDVPKLVMRYTKESKLEFEVDELTTFNNENLVPEKYLCKLKIEG
jgi:hypothetical protein